MNGLNFKTASKAGFSDSGNAIIDQDTVVLLIYVPKGFFKSFNELFPVNEWTSYFFIKICRTN